MVVSRRTCTTEIRCSQRRCCDKPEGKPEQVATIVLVHGTGVREPAYGAALDRFTIRMGAVLPGMRVAPCYWGGPCGSQLNAGGLSLPSDNSVRGIDGSQTLTQSPFVTDDPGESAVFESREADEDVALWGLLELDPLFELSLLGATGSTGEELPPNAATPRERLSDVARQVLSDDSVSHRVTAAGLDPVFGSAVEAVLDSQAAIAALSAGFPGDGSLRAVAARAFVAESLRRADATLGDPLPLDGASRDELVAAVVAALGGSPRGIGASVGRVGLDIALRLGATKPLERRRAAISQAAAPAAGDVLMYLSRGEALRGFIGDTVTSVSGSVIIVAHSLGGIASLELLAARMLPDVALLVTVGCQAPLLYELNALPTLPFGAELPDSVPRWVNVFDRRDLLAYVGEQIFPGRVTDLEVDSRVPFPRAHSAYFGSKQFYKILGEIMP